MLNLPDTLFFFICDQELSSILGVLFERFGTLIAASLPYSFLICPFFICLLFYTPILELCFFYSISFLCSKDISGV